MLAAPYSNRAFIPRRLAFALPYCDKRRVCIRVDIKAILARLRDRESDIGSVNFINLAIVEVTNSNVQRALVQSDLAAL